MPTNLNILIMAPEDSSKVKDIEAKLASLVGPSYTSIPHTASMEQLSESGPDLVIIDPSLDVDSTLRAVAKIKIIDPSTPVLVSLHECLPIEPYCAPFAGVHLFDIDSSKESITGIIDDAFQHKEESESLSDPPYIIGQSPDTVDVREKIRKIGDKDVTVLVTGETGTGKELVARSLHQYSQRSKEPLVKVDCTSLPDELLESEVFGFQKGAFTDAYADKPGRLELADGGTLFIDEIGDLSLKLQAKLLQIFEDKEFTRLGGTEDKPIDVRIIAATNSDLMKKVKEGTFREDLFYRLNMVHVDVPPLRMRKQDIPLLLFYFQNKYSYEFKRKLIPLSDDTFEFIMDYQWPGNVRELENVIRRSTALSDWNFIIDELKAEDLAAGKEEAEKKPTDEDSALQKLFEEHDFSLKKITKAYVTDAERQVIVDTLASTQWNRTRAAKLLGVSYKTLINRINEFGIKP